MTSTPADTHTRRPRGRLMRLVLAATAGIALLGAGFGLAAASIPGPNGVIHGCYVKKTGALRVIGRGACPAGTAAISWNQRGPRGYTGPKGATGATGAAGSALGWATMSSSGSIYPSGGTLTAPTVTHPSTGLYCITGTGWVQQGGPYSLSLINSGSGGQVTLNPYFWGSGCIGAGYNITVSTFDASG